MNRAFIARVIHVQVLQFIGLITLVYVAALQETHLGWWLLALGCYFLTCCLGISVTFHRALSHNTFRLPKGLEYLFSWFGAVGGSGSSVGWVAMHRKHHACADRRGDPHAPDQVGYALLASKYDFSFDENKWLVRDLIRDPYHSFIHRYYVLILLSWALLLALIDINALIFVFLIPAGLQITAQNLSNFCSHKWGYRNFETNDASRNNWAVAIVTWGEGWHNNHHGQPAAWKLSHRWWEIDISGMVIWCLQGMGKPKPAELSP